MPKRGLDAHLQTELAALAGYQPGKLAELARCHPRKLQREFHRLFGCSPREWLRRQRLQHIESLLLSGGWVKEAAIEANFKDVSSFSRWFKKIKRVSPSGYISAAAERNALPHQAEDWSI
jgi:AraC-like DNA-binding protein